MFAKIIGFFSCLLCAFPLFIMGVYGKDSLEPITFWTGDTTLKGKVCDVKSYNAELSSLYKKCALAFVITGIFFLYPSRSAQLQSVLIVCQGFISCIESTRKF